MRILIIPHVSWKTPQRMKVFAREFSKKHEVHVIDLIADFYGVKDYFSRRYLKIFSYYRYQDSNITVHHIPRISPALFSKMLRNINYKISSHYVSKILMEYGIEVVIGTFIVKPPEAGKLIFDAFDDNPAYWMEFGLMPNYAEEIKNTEKEYMKKSDYIVVASSVLADRIKKMIRGVWKKMHIIPNGVDVKKYFNANGDDVRKRHDLNSPVVGYVGKINYYREAIKVIHVAKILKRNGITFLVVGDGKWLKKLKDISKRRKLSNVIFTGFISEKEIPEYYKAIDIGVCPYIKSYGRDAGFPLKLLEYTAAGKPVVSTDLVEVKRLGFSNVLLVKDSPKSLAEGIKKILKFKDKYIIPVEKIRNFDIRKLAEKYETLFRL